MRSEFLNAREHGCPTEKVCTSQDTTIGQCVDPDPQPQADPQPFATRDEGGCGCSTPGAQPRGIASLFSVAFAALGAMLLRKRA